MSMILGVYQRLAQDLNHQEGKRSPLRKDSDVLEIQQQSRVPDLKCQMMLGSWAFADLRSREGYKAL